VAKLWGGYDVIGALAVWPRRRNTKKKKKPLASSICYMVFAGHKNWRIETAVWNLAGFLHCALETRWQRFGQFLKVFLNDFCNDLLCENLNLLYENLPVNVLYENLDFLHDDLRFSLCNI